MNKYYLSVRDFRFPLTVNLFTNAGTLLFALMLKPCIAGPMSSDMRLSVAIGIITALDIGASNAGLTLLPVSFHTVIRGAIPGLVLIFALIARLEEPEVRADALLRIPAPPPRPWCLCLALRTPPCVSRVRRRASGSG